MIRLSVYPHWEAADLFFRIIGPEKKIAGENWTKVEVFQHIPGKYGNTFKKLYQETKLLHFLERFTTNDLLKEFDRPIIEYGE